MHYMVKAAWVCIVYTPLDQPRKLQQDKVRWKVVLPTNEPYSKRLEVICLVKSLENLYFRELYSALFSKLFP